MIKILFQTNLDVYSHGMFPQHLTHVPRVGELVLVDESYSSFLKGKKLPGRLEVVSVSHLTTKKEEKVPSYSFDKPDNYIHVVVCELWYNETDAKIAKASGAKLM